MSNCCLFLRGNVSIGPAFALDGQSLDLTNWIPAPTLAPGQDFIGYGQEYGSFYGGQASQPSNVTPTATEFDGLPLNAIAKRRMLGVGNAQLNLSFNVENYEFAQNYSAESVCAAPLVKDVSFILILHCATAENIRIAFGDSENKTTPTTGHSDTVYLGDAALPAGTELNVHSASLDSILDVISTEFDTLNNPVTLINGIDFVQSYYGIKLLKPLASIKRTIQVVYTSLESIQQSWQPSIKRNHSLVFNGFNMSDERKVHLEIYRAKITPVSGISLTDDDIQNYQVTGKVMGIKRAGKIEKYKLSISKGADELQRQYVTA